MNFYRKMVTVIASRRLVTGETFRNDLVEQREKKRERRPERNGKSPEAADRNSEDSERKSCGFVTFEFGIAAEAYRLLGACGT
jgi:hypothetical protein